MATTAIPPNMHAHGSTASISTGIEKSKKMKRSKTMLTVKLPDPQHTPAQRVLTKEERDRKHEIAEMTAHREVGWYFCWLMVGVTC